MPSHAAVAVPTVAVHLADLVRRRRCRGHVRVDEPRRSGGDRATASRSRRRNRQQRRPARARERGRRRRGDGPRRRPARPGVGDPGRRKALRPLPDKHKGPTDAEARVPAAPGPASRPLSGRAGRRWCRPGALQSGSRVSRSLRPAREDPAMPQGRRCLLVDPHGATVRRPRRGQEHSSPASSAEARPRPPMPLSQEVGMSPSISANVCCAMRNAVLAAGTPQ